MLKLYQILGDKIKGVILVKVGINDASLSKILSGISVNSFIQYLILDSCEMEKLSTSALIEILTV